MVHADAQMARSLARKDDDHVTWCIGTLCGPKFSVKLYTSILSSRRYVWFIHWG